MWKDVNVLENKGKMLIELVIELVSKLEHVQNKKNWLEGGAEYLLMLITFKLFFLDSFFTLLILCLMTDNKASRMKYDASCVLIT